jgi:hypothetical protein
MGIIKNILVHNILKNFDSIPVELKKIALLSTADAIA